MATTTTLNKKNEEDGMMTLRERKPNLSEQTYNTYNASLKHLKKIAPNFEFKLIANYVHNLGNPVRARNLLTPLLIIYDGQYRGLFNELRDDAEELLSNQKPSKRQTANVTTSKHIKRMLRRMREDVATHRLLSKPFNQLTMPHKRLLVAYISFTLLLDVTMRSDLNSIQVVKTSSDASESDKNYYVRSTSTLWLNRFKTYKSFARREMLPLKLEVQQATAKLLRKYIRQLGNGQYLFSLYGGQKLTKQAHNNILTSFSHKYLGVRIGTTMLRHIVLSEFDKTNPSLADRKKKMRSMQQLSIETQMRYAFR